MTHGGYLRWYLEIRSASFVRGNPVVIMLHGGTGCMKNANDTISFSLQASSERNGFMILAPNAVDAFTNNTKAPCSGNNATWNNFPRSDYSNVINPKPSPWFGKIDDVGYIRALAKWAVDVRGADPNRAYLVGASAGGAMIYRTLMETFPPMFAAAATFGTTLPVLTPEASKPNTTTPLFIMMGTRDPIIKWEGGTMGTPGRQNFGVGMSAQKIKEFWIAANKADVSKVRYTSFGDYDLLDLCTFQSEVYPPIDAAKGAPVEFYTVKGGGHTLPHPTNPPFSCWWRWDPCVLGPQCRGVSGMDLAWSFLSQHKLKTI